MELRINTKKVKIQELKPNKWNPKLKPEDDLDVQQQYEEVVKSIKTYGLIDPILVRSARNGKELGYYEIINGYHRFLACKELNMPEIIINDLGEIDDLQAKKLTIVTEEIKIPIDQVKLSHLLKEMMASEDLDKLAEGLPYSKELIQSKVELLDFDWDSEEKKESENNSMEEPLDEINANSTSLSLFFDTKEDKILVEGLFELIKKEQNAKSVPEALVLFTKTYGKPRK
jgi:ParB/RepB/Spo0J family partition protein